MSLPNQGAKMHQQPGSHKRRVVAHERPEALRYYFGSNALARKDLEQNRMRNPPVNDVGFSDTGIQRVEAGVHFRQHAFRDRPFFHHALDVFA